jgi:biotin carboxyl carrier protein
VSGTLVEVRVTAAQAVEADQDLAVLETDG